jgi:hypothetical protein
VEAMEDELRVGPVDGHGAGAGGIRDVDVVYSELGGAGHSHEKVELIGA